MTQYDVTGMSCAACSARVEKAVRGVSGVSECSVNLLTNSMTVGGSAPPDEIIAAVTAAGYGASLKGKEKPRAADEKTDSGQRGILHRLIASLLLLAVLMYISMGHSMWGLPLPAPMSENYIWQGIVQLLLSAAVMIINQRFFTSGFKGLFRGAPNMDTLVSLGSGAAFGYSTYALFLMTSNEVVGNRAEMMHYMHELYFESAAMILTLITVGKLLEARSKGKTTDALKGLISLAPKTAVVMRGGREKTVPAEEVRRGDVFLVRPGESVPADGIVLEGSSAVNESALTGESIPVDKAPGDSVTAATINQSGFIKCEATKVGEDTALSQIIKLVSDASASKAPISRAADKVSGIFVPAVLAIALITSLIWLLAGRGVGFSLARGISVLVISCPCALGLATPVAIMVGSGVGARNGILFKNAAALEHTGRVNIAVLDKTGTITRGEPVVTDIIPADGTSEHELLQKAYSLEKNSEHPLARAILKEAEKREIKACDVSDFRALAGNGLSAVCGGKALRGGKLSFAAGKITIPDELKKRAEALSEHGKTPLFFSEEERFCGIIAVADVIKEDSRSAVSELKKMGMRVVMLTGDNERCARAIGNAAGVDEVIAEVLPAEKERAVTELKKQGKVIMVGDGINDAPALTAADVGAAIGAGTDIAIDAADIVLMKSRLSDVAAAIRLGRATLKNIHENLFWAFIYNVIGIPLAAGALIPLFNLRLNPMIASAAMSLSSFCVVTNALRLNPVNIYGTKKSKRREDKKMKLTLKVEGMMCPHCEAHVKEALEAVDGVSAVSASHKSGTAEITLAKETDRAVLISAVEAAGYSAE